MQKLRIPLLSLAMAVGIIMLLFCGLLLLSVALLHGWLNDPADGFRNPSDATLTAMFHAERQHFERLREMVRQDQHLGSVGTDTVSRWQRGAGHWYNTQTKEIQPSRKAVLQLVSLPAERDADYRRLFAATTAYRVTATDPARLGYDVEIHLTRIGNIVRGRRRSMVYAPATPLRNMISQKDPGDSETFAPVGDGWYLRTSLVDY